MITNNQTHVADALARLPSQFNDSTNLRNLISIFAGRSQGLNDDLILLLNSRSVNDATGQQLDNIATIFNLTRIVGETDTAFRGRILSTTDALARSGEPEHVIESFINLTSASNAFYDETYPAGIQVTAHVVSDSFSTQEDTAIVLAMDNIRAGGVSIILVIATATDYLTLDSSDFVDVDGNGTIDATEGLGSVLNPDGGQLSRVLVANLPLVPYLLALAGESFMEAGEANAHAGYFTEYI